ncbi:MAG: SdrD B-like domain-containing protein [Saprospiraceae bacterium]
MNKPFYNINLYRLRDKGMMMFSLAGLVMLNFLGVLYFNYKINHAPAAASLQINKVVSEANPLTGAIFTYRLQYRCASLTDDCTGVMITDPLPPEVEFVSMTGSSHTVNEVYNAGTRTCTFTFQDPLTSGTTGQVLVRVRFPNGTTPNGTTASNTATISGTNAPAVTATVTATAVASDKVEVDKEFLNGGSVGGTATYHLGICNNGGVTNQNGTLRAENIIIRDTLPPGSIYISSNVGAGTTVNYNAIDHIVTLTRASLDPGQCIFPKVTLSYPDPPFNLGSTVTNIAYFSYTPVGESPVTNSDAETITIINPTPYAISTKRSSHTLLRPNNNGWYEISADIAGTEDLDDFCITDTIPAGIWIRRFSMGGWYYGGATGPAPNIINVSYTTNLNGPTLVAGSPFSMWDHTFFIDVEDDLGLLPGGGEYITSVTYCFGDVPAGLATYEPIRLDHSVMASAATGIITNCAELTTSSPGIVLDEGCANLNITASAPGSIPDPWKSFRFNNVNYFHDIGDTTTVFLRTKNGSSAGMDLTNPTMYELLPAELTYISGSQNIPGSGIWNNVMGAPVPIFTETPNYNGTGRTLLTWSWTGASSFDFAPGDELRVYIDVIVNENAVGGENSFYNEVFIQGGNAVDCWGYESPDIYDLDGDGNRTELICTDSTRFNVTPVVSLESEKLVKGQLDTDWTKYPATGYTVPGGLADYQLTVRNKGNIELDSIIIIDILPFVGDEGVIDLNTRNSRWRPNLVGAVNAPPGVTIYYSTQGNPCRSAEQIVASGPAGCTAAGWTTTPPADITTVQSLKFDFGATILEPKDSLVLEWPMRAPVDALTTIGAQPDSTAWSSFGYIGQRVDNGDFLLPTEPIKVGISMSNSVPAVIGDYVWVDQSQNGRQNGSEPGYDGMRVELFKDNGDGISDPSLDTFINFTATANGGYYLFPYLPAGDYFILFYKPAPYGITTPDAGGNDAIDSDAQLMNYNGFVVGVTPVTNLSGTEYDLDWDFGIYPNDLGAIGNYVWADINNDGIQNEATSLGVNGIIVNLYQNSSPSTIYATRTTADDVNGNSGYYLFDALPIGDYFLEFVLPTGPVFTNQGATGTSDAGDSDVNTSNGRTEVFSVVANVYDDSWDAGLILSGVEICDNGIDDDFDGEIDEGCDEICTNGIDDDGDGLIDCEDPDCNANLLSNPGFENTGTATFSTTFEGSPAEPLPRSSTLVPNWLMDYSCLPPCPESFLIDDSANTVNNPEGDHFIWLASATYCARQSFQVENGTCYAISLDVASWSSPGPQAATSFSVEALGGGINNGTGIPLDLYQTAIPPSASWNNLNWQRISFIWEPGVDTTTNLYFSQNNDGADFRGLAIDNLSVTKVCCDYEPEDCTDNIDNDGDGLIDCNDGDCNCFAACGDTDGDGIGDNCDLDDDNDGIPDLEESKCDDNIIALCSWDHNSTPYTAPNIWNPAIIAAAANEVVGAGLTVTEASTTLEIAGLDQSSLGGAITDQDYLEYSFTTAAGIDALYVLDFLYTKNDFAPAENYGYLISIAYSNDGFASSSFLLNEYEINTFVNGTQQDIRVVSENQFAFLAANTSYTFRIYFYGKSTPGIARFDDFAVESGQCQWRLDTDNDGILNHLDLDSDNDGIFDAHEAGHGETVGADGRIVGADTGSGVNGLFDVLETVADSDILNYSIADSENSADGIYDPYELDSDGDLCYDTKEENVSDSDNDGIAGTGTPTVDAAGLVNGHTYITPPNNFWQDASLSNCLTIAGVVFEDINYGGGDGRNYATADASAQASGWNANDIAVENARVELYNSSGDFLAATQTNTGGQYSFSDLAIGTYSVRVVNQSVASNRASNSTGERITPVQTFRRNSTTEIVNEVGGVAPNLIDDGANTSNANLSTLTTSTTVAQSITAVTLSNADIGNINFGYNFDVVVNINDGGQGSLRQFILNSNELANTNLDQEDNPTNGVAFPKALAWETSIFMIPGAGNHTIQPLSVLPTILDDQTHLTAYTQNGAVQGPINSRTLNVEIYGDGASFDGLTVRASDVQISGFSINSFRKGIYSNQSGANNTFVWGNYIGTKLDGTTSATNTGIGVHLYNINNSYVGTNADNVNDANEGNVVSNSYDGVELRATSNVLVAGNYVGIDKNGTADLGNRYIGVHIRDAAGVNHIGFNDALANNNANQLRNVLSGNGTDGVRITNGDNQVIAGNYIGTDFMGMARISNTGYGIQLLGNINNLIIGTNSNGDDDVLERNLISGNGSGLRFLSSSNGTNNRIAGNFIGTDVTGNNALGNLTSGIELSGTFTNTIVGTNGDNINDLVERNIISGNVDDGIRVSDTNGHTIAGNYIGVGADGVSNVGNQKRGILLSLTASNNTIGFDPSMANTNELEVGNQIKNNNDAGIGHAGTGTQNRISRNQLANNAGIGIDLGYDSVTANDNGDGDTGANTLLNFPVLESVVETGGNLVITGFAPSGATIEFFRADAGPNPNPLPGGFTTSFGEGAVYLFTAIEGSGNDTDGTLGSYVDDGTGATSTKTQNRFEFIIDTTGFNLSNGLNITATATDVNENTSEFSGWLDFRFTEVCDNGLDDDGDGLTDCEDDDCEVLASPFTLATCDNSNGGGRGVFFLPDANTIVSNGNSTRIVSYHESLTNAQNRVNILPNSFISDNNTLYARVENSATGCYATSVLTLSVGSICAEDCADGIDNDGDGLIDCQDCDECATFAGCGDNDGDGIGDLCDLDDDNDGIPDLIECPGFTYGTELVINGDFEDAYANWTSNFNRGRNNNGPTRDGCSTQGWVAISPCASYNGICDSYYNYYGAIPDGSIVISDTYGTGANVISTTNCNTSVDRCIAGPLPDHTTTGTGLSLYVDPSNIAGRAYWQQLVTVEAGKNYEFSAWIMVIEEDPNLQFRINGSNLTAGFNLDRLTGGTEGPDSWQQFFASWYSAGTSGDVLVELVNLTAGCGGNDIRVDDVSLREIITDCDCDGDGVDNSLDLDSDNDGILDVAEAGHGAIDANNDGIIDDAALNSGDNGLYNLLETVPESGIINYTVADSETTPDGIFDTCELDADGDGCLDAEEEAIADPDGDGRAGTGVPSVNPTNGLINTITYVAPPNNNWQNPLVGPCLSENCNDGIDNDADGLTDCDDPDCITSPAINISSTTACVNEIITVAATNIGGGATYTWDFGIDATPATATGIGPHNVAYTSCGTKNIQLTAFRNTCTIVVDSSINVIDDVNPVWATNPQDLIMECLPSANYSDSISIWLNNYGNGAVTDNCNSVRVINDYSGLTTDCGSTASTVVTFTAIDSCGNTAIAMANIQILDRLAPEIVSIDNITVDCDVIPAPPSPIIVDSCDVNPDLVFQEVIIQHPNDTWKASSNCSILYEISSGSYDDKSTASTADDEVIFTITVIGQNVSTGWNATVNSAPISGEYYKTYQVGPLTFSGTTLSFTITDNVDSSCAVTVTKDIADF